MKKRSMPKFFPQKPNVYVMSQSEIAKIFGVTPQAIQQIESKAIKKFAQRFSAFYPDTIDLIRYDS